MWVIFALLDPDPDSKYGSGSIDLLESGSETLLYTGSFFQFIYFSCPPSAYLCIVRYIPALHFTMIIEKKCIFYLVFYLQSQYFDLWKL